MDYVVQPGDTISEIARRHHQTVFELSLNNHSWYKNRYLKVGEVVIVKPPEKQKTVIAEAKKLLGLKYKFGGDNPKKHMDCSAYTRYVFSKVGVKLPRVSYEQFKTGVKVKRQHAKEGDLVFFSRRGHYVGHVGIILDPKKGTFIQEGGKRCNISNYKSGRYARRYRGIRRVLPSS